MTAERELVLLLADIHANRLALRAVLQDVRQRYRKYRPFRVWFAGDLFGRGPDPVSAWRQLGDLDSEATVPGNHDWGVIGRQINLPTSVGWDGEFKDGEWEVILAHREELADVGLLHLDPDGTPEGGTIFARLDRMPVVCSPRPGAYLLHGGLGRPPDPEADPRSLVPHLVGGYVWGPDEARYTLHALQRLYECAPRPTDLAALGDTLAPPSIVIVGHLHCRRLFYGGDGQPGWANLIKLDYTYELDPCPECPVLLSPGSVGFPGEAGDLGAAYAVLFLEGPVVRSVTFHKAQFDWAEIRRRMKQKGYPSAIADYLRAPDEVTTDTVDSAPT